MTGPEHYREAGRLLEQANLPYGPSPADKPQMIAEAQVHALLAVAAATALGTSPPEFGAWTDAAGTRPA